MKQIIAFVCLLFFAAHGEAQPNNPYDEKGVQFAESVKYINAEINSGAFNKYDETSLAYYSAKLPLENKVTLEMATEIYKYVKTPEFDVAAYINTAELPKEKKVFFQEVHDKFSTSNADQFKAYLISKAEEIPKSGLSETEIKEQLTSVAILYHSDERQEAGRGAEEPEPGVNCYERPATCGAVVGLIVGHLACGPLCAIGGGIIGAVAGILIHSLK